MLDRAQRIVSLDLRSLAAFRIGLGLMLICDLINRARHLEAHYTDFGVLPRGAFIENFADPFVWSLHFATGLFGGQLFLFLVAGIFALGLLFGYRTRVMTVVSWILLFSLQNRNPTVLQGGDILLRLLLFWAMFLPLGARYSVDRALAPPSGNPTQSLSSWATFALLTQVSCLYLFAAIMKDHEVWNSGMAVRDALLLDQFTTPLGHLLASWPLATGILTYVTLAIEWGAAFFLMSPVRTAACRFLAVTAISSMHFGFFLTMEIGLFPWICITAQLAFLPTFVWDWVARKLEPSESVTAYYDGECGFCRRAARLVMEFCAVRGSLQPAQDEPDKLALMTRENSWIVMGANQSAHFGYDALITILAASRWAFLRPVLNLGVCRTVGERLYRIVANRRAKLSAATKFLQWSDAQPEVVGGRPDALIVSCLGLTLVWNILAIPGHHAVEKHLAAPLAATAKLLGLNQRWSMFAPYPLTEDGWYVVSGELIDGREVEVLTKVIGPIDWKKPKLVSNTYPSQRVRKYMMNLWSTQYKGYRIYFGRYLCRDWNREHFGDYQLASFKINFMLEQTKNHEETPVKKVELWHHVCFDPKPEETQLSADSSSA